MRPSHSPVAGPLKSTEAAPKRRGLPKLGLRGIVFLSLLIVSVVPVSALYKWIETTSYQRELRDVEENHLIIAQNLSEVLSRYSVDLLTTFEVLTQQDNGLSATSSAPLLTLYNMGYVAILGPDDTLLSVQKPTETAAAPLPSKDTLQHLRTLAAQTPGQSGFSGVLSYQDAPHLFAYKMLADGILALSPISTQYLIQVQKAVSFGELGHAMIVDHTGRVIAHPNPEWQATSKDASPLSVVQKMISGQTGVMQFYSPPLKADMIAGYTFVPETGWGVMVPQPVEELRVRAVANQSAALTIVLLSIGGAILISGIMSYVLARPISKIVETIQKINAGETEARVGPLPAYSSKEAITLAAAFDAAMESLEARSVSLKEALVAANQANSVKTEFISVMGHEMRTPLNGIIGSTDLLRRTKLEPRQANYLDIIDELSELLLRHVNDVLDVSRLESGDISLSPSTFSLQKLVKDTLESPYIQNLTQSNHLNVSFAEDLPATMIGDSRRLQQVIENLVKNANTFTDQGEIDVQVDLVENGQTVEINVTDTGIGIDAADLNRIFDNFVTLDASYNRLRGGAGLGLGLGISRRILQAMGGEIGVESTPGEGSRFWVRLPKTLA